MGCDWARKEHLIGMHGEEEEYKGNEGGGRKSEDGMVQRGPGRPGERKTRKEPTKGRKIFTRWASWRPGTGKVISRYIRKWPNGK